MIPKPEIINACNILFPSDPSVGSDFPGLLQQSTLKEAYRKRVFEVHPDRAQIIGLPVQVLTERFREINIAYNKLNEYILTNVAKTQSQRHYTGNHKDTAARYYHNFNKSWANRRKKPKQNEKKAEYHIPDTELMLGQFLFYNRIISLKTLLNAILWQRQQRPSFGHIALEWGILSHNDIQFILRSRSYREKFGEFALRSGYITKFQYMAILGKQRQMQKPLGQYFVEKKILSSAELEQYVAMQKRHNENARNR